MSLSAKQIDRQLALAPSVQAELDMEKKGIIHSRPRGGEPFHIRTVVKQVMMELYCRGLLPKDMTQKVYDLLDLKGH